MIQTFTEHLPNFSQTSSEFPPNYIRLHIVYILQQASTQHSLRFHQISYNTPIFSNCQNIKDSPINVPLLFVILFNLVGGITPFLSLFLQKDQICERRFQHERWGPSGQQEETTHSHESGGRGGGSDGGGGGGRRRLCQFLFFPFSLFKSNLMNLVRIEGHTSFTDTDRYTVHYPCLRQTGTWATPTSLWLTGT